MSFIAIVPSGIAGRPSAKATLRVLAEGDPDVDVALAFAVGRSPPRKTRRAGHPLSDERVRAARRFGAAQICPTAVVLSGGQSIYLVARLVASRQRRRQLQRSRLEL